MKNSSCMRSLSQFKSQSSVSHDLKNSSSNNDSDNSQSSVTFQKSLNKLFQSKQFLSSIQKLTKNLKQKLRKKKKKQHTEILLHVHFSLLLAHIANESMKFSKKSQLQESSAVFLKTQTYIIN